MSKQKSILNQAGSEVIEENFLAENPNIIPDSSGIVTTTHVPKMIKAIFQNGRDVGVALHFHYHSKTHPLKHYTLYHGLEHELPEEVIDHLETCGEAQYGRKKNAEGYHEPYVTGYKYIFTFRKKRAA